MSHAMAQENVLESILKSHPESYKKLMDQAHKYRLQIFYTQIDRNAKNEANFTTYSYRANDQEYVYPASTVKLAASVLALEKLNTLGLNKALTMRTLKNRDSQIEVRQDTSAADGQPSVEHYIKKILLVSDNEAYNRLYEFLGQRDFNETMRKKGFEGVRLTHRLQIPLPRLENQYTNPVEFLDSKNQVVYSQKEAFNPNPFAAENPILLGKGVMNDAGIIEAKPLDFSLKNAYPLTAQHEFLKRLFFPNSFPKNKRFNLNKADYSFLYEFMSKYPTESKNPSYAGTDMNFPAYCKFLYYGSEKEAKPNPNVRIFNKVGDAYGFLLDNAYVVDFEKGIEFLVTAVILCNEDEVFNDEKYDYDTIGFPFFKALGQHLYNYEVTRKKKYLPNLNHLKFDHEK
jgi:hypothetical protein